MKVCIHLEFSHFLGGFFYRKLGSGMLSSYRNQLEMVEKMGIDSVDEWDDSCDVFVANLVWLGTWWKVRHARRMGKKIILWAHVTAEDFEEVFWFNKYLVPFVRKYLAYFYNLGDIVLCPSFYTKKIIEGYGIYPEKVIVQSNGVDLNKFFPDRRLGVGIRKKYGFQGITAGMIGLVVPRKGIDTLISLAKKNSKFQFVWFGKIYSRLITKPVYREAPSNLRFFGYVEDANAAFNSLDIFIFPSYEENQGMAILEAAAVGLPILVRDIPVYEGWLRHGENCLKAKNEAEFDMYLKMLIEDAEMRQRLGKEAHLLAEEHSLETVRKKFESIIKKAI
jgi:glycosyltransferase involved in cell wall biosynthesis